MKKTPHICGRGWPKVTVQFEIGGNGQNEIVSHMDRSEAITADHLREAESIADRPGELNSTQLSRRYLPAYVNGCRRHAADNLVVPVFVADRPGKLS